MKIASNPSPVGRQAQVPTARKRLRSRLSPEEQALAEQQVKTYNARLKARGIKNDKAMGQDKYLKLLVTQLRYQDPTNPLKNHEFAAQMAQFSSLEQMTRLNSKFAKMLDSSRSAEFYNLMGKQVHWLDSITKKVRTGIVDSVTFTEGKPQLTVEGQQIDPKSIMQVKLPAQAASTIDRKG